jgi:hypothetical protein
MNDYYSQCLRPGGSTTTAPQPVDSGASIVATENNGAPEAPPPKTVEAPGLVPPAEVDEQPPDAPAGACPSPFEDLDPIYCKQTDTLVPGLTSQFCFEKVRLPTQVSASIAFPSTLVLAFCRSTLLNADGIDFKTTFNCCSCQACSHSGISSPGSPRTLQIECNIVFK